MNLRHLFHRHGPDEPCPFMETSLQRMADGKASFLTRLYVRLHTARCGPCRRFLEKLQQMLGRLKEAKGPDPSDEVSERLMQNLESKSANAQA